MRNYKVTMILGGKIVFGIMAVVGAVLGIMFIVYGNMIPVGIACYIYTFYVMGMIFSQIEVMDNKLYYRNSFFITKKYDVTEIKRVKLKYGWTFDDTSLEKYIVAVAYNRKGRRMFSVSKRMVNYDRFLSLIRNKGIPVS
ncbi:MAG: hypothetical protein EOM40_03565 [Clostridia bacterium]|nr:hypothetical protein [Clostridia bacterium]